MEPTAIETILAASSSVTALVGNVFDLITDNALLVVFVCMGLIGAAVGLFKKIKRASH